MHSKFSKILTLIYICFVWGTTWVAIKYTLEGIPPFLGAMARFAIALICLGGYMMIKKIPLKPPKGSFKYLFITAILLYLIDYGLIYWGEQYLYAGATAIFFATFPLFTGVVSNFLFKHEEFQLGKYAGLILGFGGIIIIFYDQLLLTNFSGLVVWASLGIIVSAMAAAVSLVMVKKYLSHVETVSLTFHQMIWGVLSLGVIGVLRGEAAYLEWNIRAIAAVVYLGTFCTAIAFVLYYTLLKKMSAITLSSIIYVTPLVAIVAGWLLLDEIITLRIIVGTIIIFCGIAISQIQDRRMVIKQKILKEETSSEIA